MEEYWRAPLSFPHHPGLVRLSVLFSDGLAFLTLALINSGAEGSFIDESWAIEQGTPLLDLDDITTVFALDGRALSSVHRISCLVTLTISGNHWETISFFVLAGNTVILTVVNRFSKAAHFIPLPKLPSACETAQVMVDHVFKIYGLPSDIVSDRGPQFASQFWREFCHQIGASPALSSGFHPQTNGQAERTNQILGRMLRSLTSCTSASWCDQLSWADYGHNSLPSPATGLSPLECCLGFQLPLFTSQESQSGCDQTQIVPSVVTFSRYSNCLRCTCTTFGACRRNHYYMHYILHTLSALHLIKYHFLQLEYRINLENLKNK